jgi:beta-1,4-N-acetylglucosaminyltransferase
VPICYCAFLLHLLFHVPCSIVFVESFCRTENLSLTGRLLYPIADKFIVQWQELQNSYPRAEYLGETMNRKS